VEKVINFFAGRTSIASIYLVFSFEAVEGFGKLESHQALPDPLAAQKEVTVDNLLLSDCPLK
jgi:hypothetical protein